MRLHHQFEWDEKKARINMKKHGVTFDQAAEVLLDKAGDRFHLEEYDEEHSWAEERFITTASHPINRQVLLVLGWTERESGKGWITRIISARRATLAERKRYESEIY
ncbi:MAG: BrnT family toxin [Planctomycetes bacterium]|nr:BrnT family toxin [Planctomycetota bacterium]